MGVRDATWEDIPRILDMVEALVGAVSGPIPVDRPHAGKVIAGLIGSDTGAVWRTEAGFLAAVLRPTIIHPDPIAVELGWFATDGKGLRLLKRFEEWATSNGARPQVSTAFGGRLDRLGYQPVEQAWIK